MPRRVALKICSVCNQPRHPKFVNADLVCIHCMAKAKVLEKNVLPGAFKNRITKLAMASSDPHIKSVGKVASLMLDAVDDPVDAIRSFLTRPFTQDEQSQSRFDAVQEYRRATVAAAFVNCMAYMERSVQKELELEGKRKDAVEKLKGDDLKHVVYQAFTESDKDLEFCLGVVHAAGFTTKKAD